MIYLIYLALAAAVVLLSIKASIYVDLLDKNTKLSGIVSLVDSFKENMSKLVFLGTFDKVSSTKLNK